MKKIILLALLLSTQASAGVPLFDKLKMCTFYATKTTEYTVVARSITGDISEFIPYIEKDIAGAPQGVQHTLVSLAKVAWNNRTKDPTSVGMSAYNACFKETQSST